MRLPTTLAAAVAALATAPLWGDIVTVGLDGNEHPANLGWIYVQSGNTVPGDVVFQLVRGVIEQQTIGIGYSAPGGNYYALPVTLGQPSAWTLEVRMRVAESEGSGFPFGAFVQFGNTGMAIMSDSISPFAGIWVTSPFDGTPWRVYRWEVAACGQWTLFIDDVPFTAGAFAHTQGELTLAFGDGSGGANANASYDSIELRVNNGDPADFDGNGIVDAADLAILLGAWGGPGLADLDCSGATDAADLAILLGRWS